MIKKIKDWQIILFSCTVVALVIFCGDVKDYMRAKSIFENPQTTARTLTLDDFYLEAFKPEDNDVYRMTDGDPQIILEDAGEIYSVKFYMEYYTYPGEMVVYYTTDENQGYNEKNKAWAKPVKDEKGWFEAKLPGKDFRTIRIDPTIYRGNRLKFGDFIINGEKSLTDFVEITPSVIFDFIVYSGVLWSVLRLIHDFVTKKYE